MAAPSMVPPEPSMNAPLDRTLADLEPAILDRWTARLAATGLSSGDDRAALRALLAEVRDELRRPVKAAGGAIPLRVACAPAPAANSPGIRPEALLALAVGPEAVLDAIPRAEGAAAAVAEAFGRV